MSRALLTTLSSLVLAGGWALAPSVRGGDDAPAAIAAAKTVPSPAGGSAAQPQLTSSSRGVLLSWVERKGTRAALRYAERTATGWTPARTVAAGDDWFVNWADVPSVLRLDDRTLAAHWLQRSGPEKYAYDVRLSRSRDDGRTWAPAVTPHHDGTRTEHGFASLFGLPGGALGVLWLDGRATTPTAAHGDGHGPGGAMTVRAATYDAAWTQTSDAAVDLRACDCCPTTVAMTSEGPIAAWRDRSDDEVRDIVVARWRGGRWTTPSVVHADGWRIQACPVNGPMLAAEGRRVALAWFTAVGDVGHAYVALSSDAGSTFGAPVRLDDEAALGRVDVALLPDGAVLASWIDLQGTAASFAVRRVSPAGTRSALTRVARLHHSRASGYPRLAVHGDEIVFAWTEPASAASSVRTAMARVR